LIRGTLVDAGNNRVLFPEVNKTVGWFDRMRGLLGQPEPEAGQGLLITPCSSIHMFFMRYPLDIIFLDSCGVVVAVRRMLRPWRMAACPGAKAVLEVRGGQAARANITRGTRLRWQ
jgi:uncharacterized membrane protein (UPF0127 family)